MNVVRSICAAGLLMLCAGGAAASGPTPVATTHPSALGVWRNPKNSVHLEIHSCGEAACGTVIWSTPKADAAARKGSGKPIIGQQLLRDFVWDNRGYYKGKVYVPDLNMTFTGTAEAVGDTLHARGCLLGRLICKSQTWTRVS